MPLLLEKHVAKQVARTFENAVADSALKNAGIGLGERSSYVQRMADVIEGRTKLDQFVAVTLFGKQMATPMRNVSVGCIDAMNFIWDQWNPLQPKPHLDFDSLSYLASNFSDPNRVQGLLSGNAVFDDEHLRSLLLSWGLPFLACVSVVNSELPGVKDALTATFAPNEAAMAGWTEEKNERRCALIDKKVLGNISADELEEFNRLQDEMRQYVDRVAPLPIAAAERLRESLLRKQSPQE